MLHKITRFIIRMSDESIPKKTQKVLFKVYLNEVLKNT